MIGSFATAVTILVLKKRVDPNAEVVVVEKAEEEISWDDLTIN